MVPLRVSAFTLRGMLRPVVKISLIQRRRISFSAVDIVFIISVGYWSGPGATPHFSRVLMMSSHCVSSSSLRRRSEVPLAVR